MTILLARKNNDGEIFYGRFCSKKPTRIIYAKGIQYRNGEDPVSKLHYQRENKALLSKIEECLELMEIEAKKKLARKSFTEQCRIMQESKSFLARLIREQGNFYEKEFFELMRNTDKRIEEIYSPYIKDFERARSPG